jgi:ubiquinone/menaquinone biosynthesis C-methylase UbiE
MSVLDVPFGTGRFLPLYNNKNHLVTGLDSSQDMVDQAKDKFGNSLTNVSIDICDARKMPYQNGQFDLSVCFRFLPWIVSFKDLKIILNELSRVSKKYTIIELCVGSPEISGKKLKNELSLYDQLNEIELRKLLLEFSFNTIKIFKIYDDEEHPGLSAFLCKKV